MATEETKREDANSTATEIVLHKQRAQFDHKLIELTLNDNHRGRYARVRECGGRRFNNIIVPQCGFQGFSEMWQALIEASDKTPPKEMDQG